MADDDSFRRIAEAFDLAARAHQGQVRRGGRREPFVNHVADVARRVARSPHCDEATIVAAVLHDAVEKGGVALAEVEAQFGTEVAGVVAELTDDPAPSRSDRRRQQVGHAAILSERARRVKVADKASKLASMAGAPPGRRGRGAAQEQLDQARAVVGVVRGTDPVIEADFDREAGRLETALADGGPQPALAGWRPGWQSEAGARVAPSRPRPRGT